MAAPVDAGRIQTLGGTATANAVVNLPASMVANDLLIVLHRGSDGTAAHGYPAGWTILFNDNSDASTNRISCAYKLAVQGEASTITVTQTSTKFASIAWRITGHVNPGERAPEFATLVIGSSTIPDPGTVTPTGGAKDYLFLWLGGWQGEQTSPPATQPTGYSNPIGADSGVGGATTTNVRVAGASKQATAASSENPGTWTISVTDVWTATVLAIHPYVAPTQAQYGPPVRESIESSGYIGRNYI